MTARRLVSAALAASVALVASTASAGIEDLVGLGPRAIALGGSYAARPGDFSAAYYNPAGLAPRRAGDPVGLELSLAAVYARPVLHVTGEGGRELPTPDVPDAKGAVIGARFGLGAPFGIEGLAAGLSLYVPDRLFRWHIVPDDDLQWPMMTGRAQILSSHLGLAWRAAPWLAIGAGLRTSFDVQALTRGEVTSVSSATDPQTGRGVVRANTRIGTDATVYGRVAPLFGVLVTPASSLRVGLTYRHQSYLDDWGDTRITGVPGLGNLGYTHRFAHYYDPSQVVLAIAGKPTTELELSFDLTYARWDGALSTNRNFFGEGRFGDTLTPSAGASYVASPALTLLGGYRYVPSPMDNFGGPTNLLDNDRHVASIGTALHLGELFGAPSFDASVVLAIQETFLVSRTESKDFRRFSSDDALVENPGYPGYEHGGHMLTGSLGLEARW